MSFRKFATILTLTALSFSLTASSVCGPGSTLDGQVVTYPFQNTPQWVPGGAGIRLGGNIVAGDGSRLENLEEEWPGHGYISQSHYDISPDGTRMVFTTYAYGTGPFWSRESNLEIAVSKLDGSDRHRLTENPAYDRLPRWSPDGSRIAFVSSSNRYGGHLFTMASDGSDVRSLAPDVTTATIPAVWSPDGRRLAFVGVDSLGNNEHLPIMYSVAHDGTDLQRLGVTLSQPVWSPDSRRMAFVWADNGMASLHTMDPDGGNPMKIDPDPTYSVSPLEYGGSGDSFGRIWANLAWSPDGTEILNGRNTVLRADSSGFRTLKGNDRRLIWWRPMLNKHIHMAWSPDGSKIAVALYDEIFRGSANLELLTLHRDGSDGRVLARQAPGALMVAEEDSGE